MSDKYTQLNIQVSCMIPPPPPLYPTLRSPPPAPPPPPPPPLFRCWNMTSRFFFLVSSTQKTQEKAWLVYVVLLLISVLYRFANSRTFSGDPIALRPGAPTNNNVSKRSETHYITLQSEFCACGEGGVISFSRWFFYVDFSLGCHFPGLVFAACAYQPCVLYHSYETIKRATIKSEGGGGRVRMDLTFYFIFPCFCTLLSGAKVFFLLSLLP